MKNTQKKLKPKLFRYLSKGEIKNPNWFLKGMVHGWGINWSENFNYLINSSIYPAMRSNQAFEYGFIFDHLGKMVEMAYVILKKCSLKPYSKDCLFQHTCKESFVAEVDCNIILNKKFLCDFFGFKTLKEWQKTLQDILLLRILEEHTDDDSGFDEYMPIRELLVKLPKVLHEIHNRGGLQYCLPDKSE